MPPEEGHGGGRSRRQHRPLSPGSVRQRPSGAPL